jgi:FixJ family two-component response regulator
MFCIYRKKIEERMNLMSFFTHIKSLDNNFISEIINNDLNKNSKRAKIFDVLVNNDYFLVDEVEISIPGENKLLEYSDFIKLSNDDKIFFDDKYKNFAKDETVDNLNALSYISQLIKENPDVQYFQFVKGQFKKTRVKILIEDTVIITNNIGKDELLNLLLQDKYEVISLQNDGDIKLYKLSFKEGTLEFFNKISKEKPKTNGSQMKTINKNYKEYNNYFYSPENVTSLLNIYNTFTKKEHEILSLMISLKSNSIERDLFIKQNYKFLEKHKELFPMFDWLLINYNYYITELNEPYVINTDSKEEPFNSIKKRYNLFYNRTQKMLRYLNSLKLKKEVKHNKERSIKNSIEYKRNKKYINSLEYQWFVKNVKLIQENDTLFFNIEPGYDISNTKTKDYFNKRIKKAFTKVLDRNTIEGIHENVNIPEFKMSSSVNYKDYKSIIKRTTFPVKVNKQIEKLRYSNLTNFITNYDDVDYLFFKEKNKSDDMRLVYCITHDGTVVYTARVTFTEDHKSIENIAFIFKRYPTFDNKYKPEGLYHANMKYIMDQSELNAREILTTIILGNI